MGREPPRVELLREQAIAGEIREILQPHMHVRRFAKGEILWREGDRPGLLVALRKGRVKVYRPLPTGGTVTLFLFLPGDVFGCLPLLDDGPQAASALALDALEADVMPRSVFQRVMADDRSLAQELVALLSRRLREACDVIESLSTPGACRRVASALLGMIPDPHTSSSAVRLQLPVSAQEFAGALGMAPETLSRAISDLADEGMIRRGDHGQLDVLDMAALEHFVRSQKG
ncbi:MAG: Crp/Fnr family transcriptional regulator [Gemmatimonadota bacterium]|jgi:CRP/FNR family transcriptional regulator, dissimilatory nitrate respiration regulator